MFLKEGQFQPLLPMKAYMNRLMKVLLLAAGLFPAWSWAADAGGVWKATFETQVGTQNYTYTFKVDGTSLTGSIVSGNGEAEVLNGKVEGKTITFTEILNFQGMELSITYTGEMTSDNEISFTRDVAGFATELLTAVRSE
jgi:hypothetical protein